MTEIDQNQELPVLVLPDMVLLHETNMNLKISRKLGRELHDRVKDHDYFGIAVAAREGLPARFYSESDIYHIGTLVKIENATEMRDFYHLKVEIIERAQIDELIRDGINYRAKYHLLPDIDDLDQENQEDILKHIRYLVSEISENFKESKSYTEQINKIDDLGKVIAQVFPYMRLSLEEKQAFLETRSLQEKALKFLEILIEQKESIKFQMEMAAKFNEEMNKKHRENMLKEQLRVIQDELTETEGGTGKKDYRELIEEANMPPEVKEIALEEVHKLERQGPHSSEENVIRNYLDLLTTLPWGESEIKDIDIEGARKLLNKEHYGLDKVKDRIIQHLTVMKLKQNKQGSILLLVGPPGTGKTSLGKSIAETLEREYVRISLGGVKDESEIRGHRRTYVGALPGRIIQGMKRAGTRNPVFILDEVDKLMASYSGDPASALLEVLDPEQNNTFSDHYLEVPYDLSDVFFIATANSLKGIPGPLRDRMEIIEIGSYTSHEKFHIARNHLIDEVLEDNGLDETQLQFEDEAIKTIIEKYTREAGVRGLKRQLATVARVASEKIVLGKVNLPYVVKEDMLYDLLGHELIQVNMAGKHNPPGVVTGLAWTPVGGDILFIEGAFMPGTGKLLLTGQLGDVMKESAKISQSLIRSRLAFNLKKTEFDKKDLHIHVPSGAIPKDGPSAGVALLTTIASLVTGHTVDPKLAMTGEISLRGAVLPVGGIKEKVLAAHRAGIKRVILPEENTKDLDDVPEDVKAEMEFIPVKTVEDVLKETIGLELPKPVMMDMSPDTLTGGAGA
ncbi:MULTISPECIES: endopeptidase La [Methanobacterium]|uniref:Lon protease n=1 Tax=Methanobacterium formicicum TaxID=2162 RepID=A0A090I8M1_METFO|nr:MULTISPECIES: endopeptidase La [Methanobacterium]KUK75642.1 MAG: Lon protease [Methanobacterium sp. 42_16]MBF4474084.1 endopeptidase La [Methanobacterium formicicum]MDD4809674.1 endopeptidase La [Methanobacterium formicicum]MDG3546394.1 endopeptidase La [Methanobacterium formicicum]MDH2659656.1 endopeptidase La [Methanobacterium formicicum]